MSNCFSQKVTNFHEIETPEEGSLVGYALLIDIIEKGYSTPLSPTNSTCYRDRKASTI